MADELTTTADTAGKMSSNHHQQPWHGRILADEYIYHHSLIVNHYRAVSSHYGRRRR